MSGPTHEPSTEPTIIEPTLVNTQIRATYDEACFSIDPYIFFYDIPAPFYVKPRIPIEIAENIIDFIPDAATQRHCALVCRSWLPRSRVNIWRKVNLCSLRQVYALRDTLETASEVRSLVHVLDFASEDDMMSTAAAVILPLLSWVDSLVIRISEIGLSSRAISLIMVHQNIGHLTLGIPSDDALVRIVRLLSQLKSLEVLHIYASTMRHNLIDLYPPQYDITSVSQRRCPSLREVEVRIAPHMFSVVRVELTFISV